VWAWVTVKEVPGAAWAGVGGAGAIGAPLPGA
jgi:hypothetical protein